MTVDPELPPPPAQQPPAQSGLVTSVAVVNFVLGALQLMCGGCVGIGAGTFAGVLGIASQANEDMSPEGREAAEALGQFGMLGGGLLLAFAIIYLILGIALLVAGYGVISRRKWGRILSLVLAALLGIFAIVGFVAGEWIVSSLNLIYAVFVFVVLLNKQNAAEFA